MELQLVESERLKVENDVLRRRQSVDGINSNNEVCNKGGIEQQQIKAETTKKEQNETLAAATTPYNRKSSNTSGISVESFVTHDELMEENVRLTQLILDVGYLFVLLFCYVCFCV